MWEQVKLVFTDTKTKTFAWQTLNGFLGMVIVALADKNFLWIPFVIAALNLVTKYINLKYLS